MKTLLAVAVTLVAAFVLGLAGAPGALLDFAEAHSEYALASYAP
jgi:hypothetical protein